MVQYKFICDPTCVLQWHFQLFVFSEWNISEQLAGEEHHVEAKSPDIPTGPGAANQFLLCICCSWRRLRMSKYWRKERSVFFICTGQHRRRREHLPVQARRNSACSRECSPNQQRAKGDVGHRQQHLGHIWQERQGQPERGQPGDVDAWLWGGEAGSCPRQHGSPGCAW